MADPRQTTVPLDDFQRADEFPVVKTTQYPWESPFITNAMQIEGGNFKGTQISNVSSYAYWDGDPYPMSESAGQTPETWARAVASYTFPEGLRMGLLTPSAEGYVFLMTGGFSLIVRRYTGGGGFTDITGDIDGGDGIYVGSGDVAMLRCTPTHVEGWRSSAGETVWDLLFSVPDTTYRDGLYGTLGGTGDEDAWADFGGGEASEWQQEFIRRPWRYWGRDIVRSLP